MPINIEWGSRHTEKGSVRYCACTGDHFSVYEVGEKLPDAFDNVEFQIRYQIDELQAALLKLKEIREERHL